MAKTSAGLLMCRRGAADGVVEVLLVHPGGPFFARKDEGIWSLPKGLVDPGEDPLETAEREMREELGIAPEAERYVDLGEVRQKGGKVVRAWAFAGDCDPERIESNTFELEWPPRSGTKQRFPEVDRAAFFDPETARRKILPAQRPFIDRALEPDARHALFGRG